MKQCSECGGCIAQFELVEFYPQLIRSSDKDVMYIQKSGRAIHFIKDFIYGCIYNIMHSNIICSN